MHKAEPAPGRAAAVRRGLYLLTPDDTDTPRLLARVAAVVGDAALLQYRNKAAGPALRREQAGALLPLCRAAGVPLLVNDDWPLAVGIGADGAHLGEDDGALRDARRALGDDAIIGASCYDDLARAQRRQRARITSPSAASFLRQPSLPPGARRRHCCARPAGWDCPWWPSEASPRTMPGRRSRPARTCWR